jgi:hypothetical protein
MPTEHRTVGVLAILRPPATRWGEAVAQPLAVLPDAPGAAPGTVVAEEGGVRTLYLGPYALMLHSGDTGHYRDNLESGRPALWVALRDADKGAAATVHMVTADPYEGEGLAGDIALVVEAVPIPPVIAAQMATFVVAHHVEIPFKKRKRSPATPDADPRAPRILRPEEKWGANRRGPR